jgi:hypothetical protein
MVERASQALGDWDRVLERDLGRQAGLQTIGELAREEPAYREAFRRAYQEVRG